MNRVLVGLPSGTSVPIPTFESLTNAVRLEKPDIFEFYNVRGMNAVSARNAIVWEMYQRNFTHVFFADADMVFPENTLKKLLSYNLDIVGGFYLRKRGQFLPNAFELDVRPMGKWRPVFVNDFREVEAIGTGCLLISRKAFDMVECPWFEYRWSGDADGRMITEDLVFCDKAKEKGFKVYCDGTIKCGHINSFSVLPTNDLGKVEVKPL